MFPFSLFPTSLFPGSLFPGAGKPRAIVNPFEVDLLAYLGALNLTVYPGHIPQGKTPPAITFNLITGEPKYTLAKAAGLTARNYQFSAFSTDCLQTITMEEALRQALSGFRGNMGSYLVSSCRLQDVFDMPYDTNVDASDVGTYCRVAEYRIMFQESIPIF